MEPLNLSVLCARAHVSCAHVMRMCCACNMSHVRNVSCTQCVMRAMCVMYATCVVSTCLLCATCVMCARVRMRRGLILEPLYSVLSSRRHRDSSRVPRHGVWLSLSGTTTRLGRHVTSCWWRDLGHSGVNEYFVGPGPRPGHFTATAHPNPHNKGTGRGASAPFYK